MVESLAITFEKLASRRELCELCWSEESHLADVILTSGGNGLLRGAIFCNRHADLVETIFTTRQLPQRRGWWTRLITKLTRR